MIDIVRLRVGREEYYLAQVADDPSGSYLGSGESPGRWLGSGLAGFGVAGEVAGDVLHAVLAGQSLSGSALVRAGGRNPGFDVIFRAPKSVSLLYALGAPDVDAAVAAGHDAAIGQTLDYLERRACATRRGSGRKLSLRGEGFIAASFRHRTSRAGDPLLHTHLLIANLVRWEDNRWGAFDGRLLYAQSKTASYLYQAALRFELTTRLGVDWGPVRYGMADIAGIGREVIEVFSERRHQILEVLDARGDHSPRTAKIAALATRTPRSSDSYEELVAGWREQADTLGLTSERLAAVVEVRDALRRPSRTPRELVGPEGLTGRRSSFDRRDLLQAWCNNLPTGASVPQVEAMAEDTLQGGEIVALTADASAAPFRQVLRRSDGRAIPSPAAALPRYTTSELTDVEHNLVSTGRQRLDAGVAVADRGIVEDAITASPMLAPDQQHMVRQLTGSGRGVEVVIGGAGAGTNLALDAARAAWQWDDTVVIGCALSARAAAELASTAGIPSVTVHRLITELTRTPLPAGSVLVVDEATMVGTRTLDHLATLTAKADAKLVLVGDDRQLPAIDAGGGFRALTQTLPAVRLTTDRRQHHLWERAALEQLRGGHPQPLLDHLEHGRVTTAPSAHQARQAMVADWLTARMHSDGGPMLALRRSDVDDLNRRARRALKAAGQLQGQELHAGGRDFTVGDQVIGRRNHDQSGMHDGTHATITKLHPRERTVTVHTDGGEQVRLPASYLAEGHLDHAYALTVHRTQGATFDHAFVLGDDRLYQEAGYVALSRARDTTRLYTVGADPDDQRRTHEQPDPLDQLHQALSRSQVEPSIHEVTIEP